MITRTVGKGSITYLGTIPDPTLLQSLMQTASAAASIKRVFGPVPADVEVCRRISATHTVYILINHNTTTQNVTLPNPCANSSRTRP